MLLFSVIASSQEVVLKKGMVIRKSMKIQKAMYDFNGADSIGGSSGIVIEGDNIVIDFRNATLRGNKKNNRPDLFTGYAVVIRNGKNITIRNLNAKGYKIALIAKNIESLTIENCDFSYNYRSRLNSTQLKEDISDWMSYHQNEKEEWLRYGAAIYLSQCNKALVKNCRVTGGQNGLMLTNCNNGLFYNNDFSFNSGIGIGMYRSGNNRVMYNKLNFNVRGYSHGIYNRGQDSAGILVYEQSSNNTFYKNSATHSGDGFFLWAGQTTMDTGTGGCNDNRILNNDFSYAPTNGIEVTFSRNYISGNRMYECDHGIWGGYSYNTTIKGNTFRYNRVGIAIEHGQENELINNLFLEDREAIRLWSRKQQPSGWGYAEKRDTRSSNYLVALNSFNRNRFVFNLSGTDSIRIFGNTYNDCDTIFKGDSLTIKSIDTSSYFIEDTLNGVPYVKDPVDPFKGGGKLAGRKNIMMTEWGPYDFRYPILWNTNPSDTGTVMEFKVMGPKGKWKLISAKGLEPLTGLPDSLSSVFKAKKKQSETTDIEIIAEFRGAAFIDAYGNYIAAGKPHHFRFKKYFQPIAFTVSWFAFDSLSNPVNTNYRERIKLQRPFRIETVNKIDYAWWDGIKTGDEVNKQFLTIAEGTARIDSGMYELSLTWDDAVRVYVDEKLVLDEWNPSKYTFHESPHKTLSLKLGGHHSFRVEHVELGGFATLQLKLNKEG